MNFSYGIIAAVGVLAAVSLALIAVSPDEIMRPRIVGDVETPGVPPTVSIPRGVGSPGCEVTDECYLPYDLSVAPGTLVTWNNDDVVVHTVTSGADFTHDGLFDSGLMPSGKSFEFTFDDRGIFRYYCIVHPWMIGTVQVA